MDGHEPVARSVAVERLLGLREGASAGPSERVDALETSPRMTTRRWTRSRSSIPFEIT
ncbi:hypothetical protein ACFQE8_16645 [Salinirubellus sp. GCM10025818]|uniref:hypothetical protein n=1 Tax=Salinirubellus TaxID=2162630 RepID=UPI0030CEFE99